MRSMIFGFLLSLGAVGCAASAPPPVVENVGTLAAGPSVYSAPVHETTAPPTVELAGSADDDSTDVVTTTTRAPAPAPAPAPAREPDDAPPPVVAKDAHGF